MANEIIVPKVGTNAETAVITRWLKQEGDRVRKGEALFEMVTDKATFSVESEFDGILFKIIHGNGSTVPVAGCAALMAEPGEDTASIDTEKYRVRDKAEAKKIFVTPGARKLAEARGADVNEIARSKGSGIIREKDVDEFLSPMPAEKTMELAAIDDNYTRIKPSSITMAVRTGNMHDFIRGHENRGTRVTIGELVVYAVSRCLGKHGIFNSVFSGNSIRKYQSINIGIAIGDGEKLFVPVIREADKKSLGEISSEIKEFAVKTIRGRIEAHDMTDGTMTITDLSSSGVVSFEPLINKNQSSILGIASEYGSDEKFMNLILVFDHRAANGMQAAEFLASVRDYLERL